MESVETNISLLSVDELERDDILLTVSGILFAQSGPHTCLDWTRRDGSHEWDNIPKADGRTASLTANWHILQSNSRNHDGKDRQQLILLRHA